MQNYIYIGMIKSCHTKEGEHRYWQNRRQDSAQDTGDTILP